MSLKSKFSILKESIDMFFQPKFRKFKLYKHWKKQNKKFKSFGKGSIFEKPLYTQSLKCVSIGKNVLIKKNSRIQCNYKCEKMGMKKDSSVFIDDNCSIGTNFVIYAHDDIIIGKYCLFSDNVMISTETHGINPELDIPYMRQPFVTAPVHIGENCWLGKNVSILSGVTLGKGVVVGSNSVVTHSFPDYTMIAGCPAKIIKQYNFETHNWEKYSN